MQQKDFLMGFPKILLKFVKEIVFMYELFIQNYLYFW